MKLFPQDNAVSLYETGFEDDVLERKAISKQLSELVERIEDPVVLALDDKWGSGKTFFLKRWVSAHKNENDGTATTIYFDAFENDYLTDPLVSIITAVSGRLPDEQAKTLRKWRSVASKLAKPALGIALSMATFGAKQQLDEIGDAIVDATSAEAKDVTQDLWDIEKDRKQAVDDFRNLLSELTQKSAAPIVIVIDELDRCRPDYALTVLEVIKHFFSVPKVHFILSINGKALENSVKARYGAEIDAESYLRKFINISFSLPRTIGERGEIDVVVKYASHLSSDMGLPERVSERCVSILRYVAKSRDVSLRDIGKILSKVALLPNTVHEDKYENGYIDLTSALVVTSVVDPGLHKKMVSGNAQTSELRTYLSAPEEKTTECHIAHLNTKFDREVTIWFATILFYCGAEEYKDVSGLPGWAAPNNRFDRNGISNTKSIAKKIQKDWLELFRI